MIDFFYKNGVKKSTAMTVAELRERLKDFPDDMPIVAEWEGQYIAVPSAEEGIYDGVPVLVFDADGY